MVLLIGNYPLDRQQSMLRFAAMMLEGLTAAGVQAELIQPQPFFGSFRLLGGFVAKWLAYVDKFLLFPLQLRAKLKATPAVVHICDHSNAMYARDVYKIPVVVTCHDMLAVRGALGEQTDTPASATGRVLQRWIVAGLRKADAIACVSTATCIDAERIVMPGRTKPALKIITLGLSYPYRRLDDAETRTRLAHIPNLCADVPFVLHVGSNLRRKNREAVLRIFAQCAIEWPGQLVFAGERLNDNLREQAQQLRVTDRIVEVASPDNELLEALYNGAGAFLFPSRFEGFGWPIAEAQACGCPVVCSSVEPMAEVAGAGALLRAPDDEAGFAADLLRLLDPAEQQRWREKALANATRFAAARMVSDYCALYRSVAPVC